MRRLINSSSASVDGDRFWDFRICLVGAVARCLSRRGGYSGDDSPSVDGGSSFSLPLGGSFDPPSVALSSSRESSCIAMYSLNATSIESSSWDDNFSARFIVADPGFVVFDFVSANESFHTKFVVYICFLSVNLNFRLGIAPSMPLFARTH